MSTPHAEREVWIRCGSCRRGLFRCHGRGQAGKWIIASGAGKRGRGNPINEPELFYEETRVPDTGPLTPITNAKIRCPKCHREHSVNFAALIDRIGPDTKDLLLGVSDR